MIFTRKVKSKGLYRAEYGKQTKDYTGLNVGNIQIVASNLTCTRKIDVMSYPHTFVRSILNIVNFLPCHELSPSPAKKKKTCVGKGLIFQKKNLLRWSNGPRILR